MALGNFFRSLLLDAIQKTGFGPPRDSGHLPPWPLCQIGIPLQSSFANHDHMFPRTLAFIGRLSLGRVLLVGLFCAVAIEAVTAALRFGLDLQSTRDTGVIGYFTFGLRIHHGYLGVILAPIALCFRQPWRNLLTIAAVGLFVSDLFHHFLVLWPLTGSPQFDFFYASPALPAGFAALIPRLAGFCGRGG
jgi:hypothetical protein